MTAEKKKKKKKKKPTSQSMLHYTWHQVQEYFIKIYPQLQSQLFPSLCKARTGHVGKGGTGKCSKDDMYQHGRSREDTLWCNHLQTITELMGSSTPEHLPSLISTLLGIGPILSRIAFCHLPPPTPKNCNHWEMRQFWPWGLWEVQSLRHISVLPGIA